MGLCLCTHIFDDDHELSKSQSFQRDMSVLRSRIHARRLPVVWFRGVGSPTHASAVAERFGFACLDMEQIMRREADKDTSRGRLIKAKMISGKRFPDRMTVDILKEHFIQSGDTRGYLIAGFPQTAKQAQLFTREIAAVDCIVLLYAGATSSAGGQGHAPVQSSQAVQLPEGDRPRLGENVEEVGKKGEKDDEILLRDILDSAGVKWDIVVEKINVNEPPADVFLKIEAAILDRTATVKT